jgi:hypothetical protein
VAREKRGGPRQNIFSASPAADTAPSFALKLTRSLGVWGSSHDVSMA